MPFAEGQSLSPRVTPELLHPASMDAADACGVIIDGQEGPTWFNYQVQLCVTPRNTWIACWTQGGYESTPDQRVVVARSLDEGRTWGSEIVIEAAAESYRVPAWIASYVVPHTGRVYVLYWYNDNGVPLRDAGDVHRVGMHDHLRRVEVLPVRRLVQRHASVAKDRAPGPLISAGVGVEHDTEQCVGMLPPPHGLTVNGPVDAIRRHRHPAGAIGGIHGVR